MPNFATMTQDPLLAAFTSFGREQWEQLILKELKGRSPESLGVQVPGAEPLRPLGLAREPGTAHPGDARRGIKRGENSWRMTADVRHGGKKANRLLLEDRMGGADSAVLTGSSADALKDVMLDAVDLQFEQGSSALLRWLVHEAERQKLPVGVLRACVGLPLEEDPGPFLGEMETHPHLRLFNIPVRDASVPTMRTALLQGKALVDRLRALGLALGDASNRIQFTLSLDDALFVEIARLRAFRAAWHNLIARHERSETIYSMWLQAEVRYPVEVDGHWDLIRGTLQAVRIGRASCRGRGE